MWIDGLVTLILVGRENTQQTERDAQNQDWYSDQGQQILGGTPEGIIAEIPEGTSWYSLAQGLN